MYLVAGGSVASGGGSASILITDVLRVDPNGDDSTAVSGDFGLPYQTIAAAMADAVAGDTVIVGPGSYNEPIPIKDLVNLHFQVGAKIDWVTATDGAIIDDSATGANGAVTCRITGHGEFNLTYTGATVVTNPDTACPLNAVYIQNDSSNVYIEAVKITATMQTPTHNHVSAIRHDGGTLEVRCPYINGLFCGYWWGKGKGTIKSTHISGLGGVYAHVLTPVTDAAWVFADLIEQVDPGALSGASGAIYMSGSVSAPEARMWVICSEVRGRNYGVYQTRGKLYLVGCQKLSSTLNDIWIEEVAPTGTNEPQFWANIQKVSHTGTSPGINVTLDNGFGSSDIEIIHYEFLTPFTLGTGSTAHLISGSKAKLRLGRTTGLSGVVATALTLRAGATLYDSSIDATGLSGTTAAPGHGITIPNGYVGVVNNCEVMVASGKNSIAGSLTKGGAATGASSVTIFGSVKVNAGFLSNITTVDGINYVPTAAPGTNNLQVASTAYADASSTAAASTKADSVHTHVYTDLPDLSPTSLLGNPNGGSSSPEEVDIGTGLGISGGALNNTDRGSTAVTTHEAAVNPHTQYAPKADPIFTSTLTASTHFTINSSGSLRINGQAGQFPIDIYNAAGTTALFRVTNGTGDVTSLGTYNAATAYRVTAFGAYMGVNAGARFIFQNGYTQLVNPIEHQQVAAGGTPSTDSFRIYGLDVAGTCEAHVKDEAGNQTQFSPHAMDGPASLYDLTDPLPHVVKEHNDYLGGVRYLNVSRTCYLLEELLKAIATGTSLATIRTFLNNKGPGFIDLYKVESFAQHNARLGWIGTPRELVKRDWDTDQDAKQAEYDAKVQDALNAHAAWLLLPPNERGPEPVVPPAIDIRKPKPAWLAARES